MAAGLGFKTFTTGEVLTAADTNGYLMQGILVFASAAARDAAITSPQEGQACYLKDTNQVLTYSGSAWVAVGGGSPLTTKGDLYTFSTVDARLGVGANNTVLTADSAEATGLKWAAPAGGGLTLSQIATGTLSGSSVNLTGLSSYDTIIIAIVGGTWATANSDVRFRLNGVSTGGLYYYMGGAGLATGTEQRVVSQGVDAFESNNNQTFNNATNARILTFENCKSAGFTTLQENASYQNSSGNQENMNIQGWFASAAAVSSIAITTTGGYSFNGGTYYVIAG